MASLDEPSQNGKPAWYFGYGSNMVTSVMRSRGTELLEVKAVCVPGYILTFDVFGLPYAEPAMASIAKYRTPSVSGGPDSEITKLGIPPDVHGVAYLLSRADIQKLIASEGGGVAYREITISGIPLEGMDESISMITLIAKYPRRPNAAPSLRYLTLLRQGAEENKLPHQYRDYLESIPHFAPGGSNTSWRKRWGAKSFLWVGMRIVRALARRVRQATNASVDGQCPEWYSTLIYYVYTSMWWWHDRVHSKVFGRGDGGNVHYGDLILPLV
ncbi:hypothetical protein QBC35DRAFT_510212 [Podospora australis]|uniref:gamma-glutamylcyclotransferase n=1 Tax=Podospora australis TaxID=1536484 RepID=A0AAN7ADY4_9PEZI|nr:hypothetical protein QBC35DRAFT_510212 [Podospora australis]